MAFAGVPNLNLSISPTTTQTSTAGNFSNFNPVFAPTATSALGPANATAVTAAPSSIMTYVIIGAVALAVYFLFIRKK